MRILKGIGKKIHTYTHYTHTHTRMRLQCKPINSNKLENSYFPLA